MQTSEQTKELYEALLAVQQGVGAVQKDKSNNHLGNRYASLSAIMTALLPALGKAGLLVIHDSESDLDGLTVATRIVHPATNQWLESTMTVPHQNDRALSSVQSAGKQITYLKRYQLGALFAIVVDEDDDGNIPSARQRQRRQSPPPQRRPKQQPPTKPAPPARAGWSIGDKVRVVGRNETKDGEIEAKAEGGKFLVKFGDGSSATLPTTALSEVSNG